MLESTAHLIGNLVEDPDLKIFSNGSCLATFRLACSSRRFDRSQDRWVDGQTVFMRVSCWRQLAENVSASLRRGDRAVVLGRLRQNTYEARDGSRRTTYEVDADVIGAELTWQSVHVRRTSRSSAGNAGPAPQAAGVVPASADPPPAGSVPMGAGLPGGVPAGYPAPAGVGGGYPGGYAPYPTVVGDRPYPTSGYGSGTVPGAVDVGADAGAAPAGPAGWDRRSVPDNIDERVGGPPVAAGLPSGVSGPGEVPAVYPPPAGVAGGYRADRSYPAGGFGPGPGPILGPGDVGVDVGAVRPGPGGWNRRTAPGDTDEQAAGYEDTPDEFEPDELDSPLPPELPA